MITLISARYQLSVWLAFVQLARVSAAGAVILSNNASAFV